MDLVVYAATLWLLGSAFLLFPLLGLAPWYHQVAMTLVCAELVALLVRSYAPPGGIVHQAAQAAASQDIPALGVLLYGLAITRGVRQHRRAVQVTTRSRSAR